jgi:hypothetical protein
VKVLHILYIAGVGCAQQIDLGTGNLELETLRTRVAMVAEEGLGGRHTETAVPAAPLGRDNTALLG